MKELDSVGQSIAAFIGRPEHEGLELKAHPSLEGGTDTIGIGHKLTSKEAKSGTIVINGEEVAFKEGITKEQAESLLTQDIAPRREEAQKLLEKSGIGIDEGKLTALTSLLFNVKPSTWNKSEAKKALLAGDIETFLEEAFDRKKGFVRGGGKVLRGLVNRRERERELFEGVSGDRSLTSFVDERLVP